MSNFILIVVGICNNSPSSVHDSVQGTCKLGLDFHIPKDFAIYLRLSETSDDFRVAISSIEDTEQFFGVGRVVHSAGRNLESFECTVWTCCDDLNCKYQECCAG